MKTCSRYGSILVVISALILAGCSAPTDDPWDNDVRDVLIRDTLAANPTVATMADGTVLIAFTSRSDGAADAYLVRLRGDGGAGEPVRVNHIQGEVAIHNQAPAQVAATPDGIIYVAWVRQAHVEGRRFPAAELRLARSTDGGETFGDAVSVVEDAGFPTSRHFHDIAVAPDGTVFVSWLDGEARDRAVNESSGANDGRSLSTAHLHEHTHGGDATTENFPGTQLKVARSLDNGASFERPVVVADNTCQCCRTALTVADDGTVFVAWRHIFGANTRDMAVASSTDGGLTFSPPARIHNDGWHIEACPHSGPSLVVGNQAMLHAAWYTGAEGREGLYFAVSNDGGRTFREAMPLKQGIPVSQAHLAVYGERIYAAYNNPQESQVVLTTLGEGRSVQERLLVDGSSPALESADGQIVLVWRDERGIRARMMRVDEP